MCVLPVGAGKDIKSSWISRTGIRWNNSRQARSEANRVATKVKEEFPELPVYTYFQPPRWLCRVGDFKSIEEAHVTMRKLKATGVFKEVSIVREQINIPIE